MKTKVFGIFLVLLSLMCLDLDLIAVMIVILSFLMVWEVAMVLPYVLVVFVLFLVVSQLNLRIFDESNQIVTEKMNCMPL